MKNAREKKNLWLFIGITILTCTIVSIIWETIVPIIFAIVMILGIVFVVNRD